jgi:hypothetical protein
MTDPVLIGLCVTSHAAGELRTWVEGNKSVSEFLDADEKVIDSS